MKIHGSYSFFKAPETLWPFLTDPIILTAVMPGCKKLTLISENQYQGELIIPVGPMSGIYTGNLSLSHIVEHENIAFTFTAQSKTGTIGGNGRIQFQKQDTGSLLSYEIEAKVGGNLANHATPLLETTARSLIRQSLENLAQTSQQNESPDQIQSSEIQTESLSSSNVLDEQQRIILVITAFAAIILFILFYFFTRKTNPDL